MNKDNELPVGEEQGGVPQIPFVKPVRVRNWKLWRGRYALKSGKEKSEIDVLHISSLDGSWMVRIPSTIPLYGTLTEAYQTADESVRDSFMGMILTNIYNISTISSEALHDALSFFCEMMSFPYLLLSEKEMKARMKERLLGSGMSKDKAREHIKKLVDYRSQLYELIEQKKCRLIADYENYLAEQAASGEDLAKQDEQDELAEQSAEVLLGDSE